MSDEAPREVIGFQQQTDENKIKTAFLQVPTELKDQVENYVKELCAQSGKEFKISNESIEELSSQGCFLVISLEKIEEIINGLKSCLSMEPDNGARNIKSEIKRVLTYLR